jgi:hypothetical protein
VMVMRKAFSVNHFLLPLGLFRAPRYQCRLSPAEPASLGNETRNDNSRPYVSAAENVINRESAGSLFETFH